MNLCRGYMAPEYLCYGQVSTKVDVFSFGVLLLEIVSGRKKIDHKLPSTQQYLVQWAQELHSNDNLPNLKDKSLEEMTTIEEATFKQVVKVGLQCLHHIAARRPMMSEVVAMLIGNKSVDDCALEDYHEGSSSPYDMGTSSFCNSTPNSSLQCIAKDDDNSHLDSKNHKQSLELCEIGLLRASPLRYLQRGKSGHWPSSVQKYSPLKTW